MTISFTGIPANLRLKGTWIEFDNSLAGDSPIEFKLAVIGQRLAAGSVAAGVPTRILSGSQAEAAFGRGSQLAEMLKIMKAIDPFLDLWAIALDDAGAGVAATTSRTFTGSATSSGAIPLYIAGKKIAVAVTSGDTQNTIATAVAAAVSADDTLPVTAAVDGVTLNKVNFTARNKGECGNSIDIRIGYYGESMPTGVTVDVAAGTLSTGATNPDIATAIAAMGSEWYNWIVCPFTDATNIVALEAELEGRWGPMQQIGARTFTAYRGNHGATSTYGNGRNSPHITCMGTNTSPTPTYIWAAVNAIVAAGALANDPARPLQTLKLPHVLPPAIADRWTDSEKNLLLWDGIAVYDIGNDGSVYIGRQITQYQENASGFADTSYLNINTPETLERIRYEQRAMVAKKFPRHKLASTEGPFGAGQPIVTEDSLRAEFIALYKEFMDKGWCEDLEFYKSTLIIEIDTTNSRVNLQDQPKLVGQLRIVAVQTQFHT